MNGDQRSQPRPAVILLRCHSVTCPSFPSFVGSFLSLSLSIEAGELRETTISPLVTKLLRHQGPGKHAAVAATALHSRLSPSVHVDTALQAATGGGNAKHTHVHTPLMLRQFRRYHMCTTIAIIIDNLGLVRPTLKLRLNPKRARSVPLQTDGRRRGRCGRRRCSRCRWWEGQWRLERTRFPGRPRSEPT